MIGKVIGEKYVLLEKIGQGGGGSVYKARDLRLGKQWAAKLLGAGKVQEAAVLKTLEHSMIPRVVDYLEEEGDTWLVMDYISGKNLLELSQEGCLSKSALLEWAIDLCQVLSYLHGRKPPYIYGDLKPENLVVSQEGKLYLVDFGAGAGRRTGICEGTPGYAAPEQARGIVTCSSDIYAFGKTWERLLGRRIGLEWKRILGKCCRPSPKKRYQQAAELEKKLRKMKRRRERRWLFLLLAGALSVCVAAGYSAGNGSYGREPDAPKGEMPGQAASAEGQDRWDRLGGLAEALGRAAGIQKEADRQRGLKEAAGNLESFYHAEQQPDRKLRAGLLLAWGYRESGCTAQAEGIYQELLILCPDSGACYGSYGCMLLETGSSRKRLWDFYQEGERAVSDKGEYNYRIWAERMNEMAE